MLEVKNQERYLRAIRKGVKWLSGIQNEDGSMNPVSNGALSYYKVPITFLIAGKHREASRLLDWAKGELFTDEGDFQAERKAWHAHHYIYSSTWYVWAAQRLSRFDISYKGMEYLLRFRNPRTGGYCSEGVYEEGKRNEQDILNTSFTSFVGLHLNRYKEAESAANWLKNLIAQQPHSEKELWLHMDGQGKLITKVPEGEEPGYYVVVAKKPAQHYYYIGGAMAFLVKLYSLSRNEEHLKMADYLFNFACSCHRDVFSTDGTGKVGLGSAYLYQVTGNKKYARVAKRCADFLSNDQQSGGYWMRGGKPTASTTGEFVTWLREILTCLSL